MAAKITVGANGWLFPLVKQAAPVSSTEQTLER